MKRIVSSLLCIFLMLLWEDTAHADQVRDAQWHLEYLRIAEAAQHSQGAGVTVAIIDSGVDASHVDLANAVLAGSNIVGPGDGRNDVDGHGTAMAGLVAARGRAGSAGAIGIAPLSMILPVHAGGPDNPFVHDAIDFALAAKVRVICLALAGSESTRLEQAISRAVNNDVVVVAAGGNRPNEGIQAPARYSGVVAAVGVNREGGHAEISTSGPEAVLAAPAVDIVSTKAGGGYRRGTGTSDATAIIAGVAALVRSKFPQLSAPEVIHRMTATAIDKGAPGRDDEYGFGIVNPVAALTANVPSLAPSTSTSPSHRTAQPPSDKNDNPTLIGIFIATMVAGAAVVGGVIALLYIRR